MDSAESTLVRRLFAGFPSLVLVLTLTIPTSAFAGFTRHDVCISLRHACGRAPHLAQCCCRDFGSLSDRNGLAVTAHRHDVMPDSAGCVVVASVAATHVLPAPRSSSPNRARSPDLTVLLGNLRI